MASPTRIDGQLSSLLALLLSNSYFVLLQIVLAIVVARFCLTENWPARVGFITDEVQHFDDFIVQCVAQMGQGTFLLCVQNFFSSGTSFPKSSTHLTAFEQCNESAACEGITAALAVGSNSHYALGLQYAIAASRTGLQNLYIM